MPFISTNWTWQNKDWLDQPAHIAAGIAFSMFFFLFVPAPWAVVFSIAAGLVREWRQHPPVFVDVDALFWTGGAVYWLIVF